MPMLETGTLDTLPIIVFRNHSLGGAIDVLICAEREVFDAEYIRLRTMEHIEIVTVTNSVIKRSI